MKISLLTTTLLVTLQVSANQIDSLSLHKIDQVIVKSYRTDIKLKDTPNKVEVITRSDILRSSATNLSDVIKRNTTCESTDMQGLSGSVEFRGFTPSALGTSNYSVMLTDGVPIGTRNAMASFLSNVQSIEIFKGPFSAMYGSGAMGGFVNVISSDSRAKVGGSATLGYGSYNTIQGNVSMGGNITKKLDFDLAVDYLDQMDDYKTGATNLLHMTEYEHAIMDNNSYSERYNNTAFDKKRAMLRVGYQLSERWRLSLTNDLYLTSKAQANGNFWGLGDQTDKRIFRDYHRLDVSGRIGHHTLRITPYFSHEKSDYDNFSPYGDTHSKYTYKTYGFLAQDAVSLGIGQLVFGIDNFSQSYKSEQASADGTPTAPFEPNNINMQTGAFVQANISLWDGRFSAIAGLRYDNTHLKLLKTYKLVESSESENYGNFNPNVAVKFRVIGNLNVHTSLGRGFIAPDAFKKMGNYTIWSTKYIGNPELKPESSFSYDYGIGYTSENNAIMADVTLFATDHKDLIMTQWVEKQDYTDIITYKNINKASIKGLELMLSADIGKLLAKSYSLKIYGNYTRIYKSKMFTPETSVERKYLSRTTATYGIEYASKRLSARLSGRYIGSKIDDNYIYGFNTTTFNRIPILTASGNEVRPSMINYDQITLPDFMIFDLYVDYSILKNLSVGLKLANILNENYMERDSYYMPGRNFMAQVSFKF